MPTGYTHGVQSGEITDFADYALLCARAFGACVELRDEPLTAEIPEIQPSQYHNEAMAKEQAELARVEAMTDAEIEVAMAKDRVDTIARNKERREENKVQRQRYEAMLAKARAYVPPTAEHKEYAKFLISQLEESIKFDCGDYQEAEPKMLDAATWKRKRIDELTNEIEYHREHQAEEIDRKNRANAWIKAVRDSVANVK